ncbi:dTDP-3-amino-3,4,6-trideoxy-alpha-D-glucopyranoseN,N-dimethyltransferase/N-dimethyltransferase [Micromonospora phaseoli]|uniref:dTDP-3-amino-3,4,6-trideoxy-alpha-D-glucopyranose N,N-dimethyltransferase/N-dimethyltransferase n=2 Tax=Micromonospora phaseoli TaxID=1144548 RepID=A0A1H7BZY8_9ACTN|nr:dTDP-3-amino-3,4,6-trideoxy-alpha-D-glucopyranose N,N-dimethyltransferase/N-dimethyltransferase [Micromonospora phaseoli]GIJ76559.1 hypothetical protein Xph01_09910 [Micromonospora phaseoli]SEJ81907.1 dTDP-3-amino-3,4,6-trideoxy-alpha-D-glucopyranoseN,N-dimethyltransferase/N-dimethyltransferase [Micromonospora phaseoli]
MPVEAESTYHDLLHADDSRDPVAEALTVLRIIQARHPRAGSLIEVGCGAGERLRALGQHIALVEGVAVDDATAVLARRSSPGTTIHQARLTGLDLGRRYDVVACLHDGLAELPLVGYREVLRTLAGLLDTGGLLLLAPFWMPDVAIRRTASDGLSRGDDGRTLVRVSRGAPRDGAHRVERHVLLAEGDGVRHAAEVRTLHAFGRREHLNALAAAGCGADFLATGLAGRPLLVGVRRPAGRPGTEPSPVPTFRPAR